MTSRRLLAVAALLLGIASISSADMGVTSPPLQFREGSVPVGGCTVLDAFGSQFSLIASGGVCSLSLKSAVTQLGATLEESELPAETEFTDQTRTITATRNFRGIITLGSGTAADYKFIFDNNVASSDWQLGYDTSLGWITVDAGFGIIGSGLVSPTLYFYSNSEGEIARMGANVFGNNFEFKLFVANTNYTLANSAGTVLWDFESSDGSFTLNGEAARTVGMKRRTTSNTAGLAYTLLGGGATSGATDKSDGGVVVDPGVTTGTARPVCTQINSYTVATSTGTSDNTAFGQALFGCVLKPANNTATTAANVTDASNTSTAVEVTYSARVFDGTNVQIRAGKVICAVANKAGVWTQGGTNGCTVQGTDVTALSSGTLAVTWTLTGANPALLQVNANSSLTPSTGFPEVRYELHNLGAQTVAIQ